eukprot:jgi/Tetstr1/461098/TSEL_006241.t1
MKVIAKKFRGVWPYGVITSVVTEWVLEIYGGATQWRAVFEDGDTVDLLRSEVVEAMAAAQEHSPVDADVEARLATVPEGDDQSIMKCSAHVKSKNFNNSADSDWQLLHDIMPAGFTWGGMAVPRSHKAMRKFLRPCQRAAHGAALCTVWTLERAHTAVGLDLWRVPGGGGGSGGEEALVLLDGPGIRKVAVLMAPAHMSCANAADLGVGAPELLVAGIHARSQDVRAKCKCTLLVAGIHARSQDAPSHKYRRRHPTPAGLTTNRHVSFGRWFIRVGASPGLGVCRRQSCEAMDTTLTDDKKRKRPVKKRRGKKLTVVESEAEAEAEAARSSKRRVPRARKNKNKQ